MPRAAHTKTHPTPSHSKTVVSINLGSSRDDYDFTTRFLDQDLRILRRGADNDIARAEQLITEWQGTASAIALEGMRDQQRVGAFGPKVSRGAHP